MLGQLDWEASLKVGVLFNTSGLLLLAVWGAWRIHQARAFDHTSWVPAFKMISKAPFAAAFLLTVTISGWNYGYANAQLEARKSGQLEQFKASMDDTATREAFFQLNPDLKDSAESEVRKAMQAKAEENLDLMYSMGFTSALNLLMLMFASLFFSLLVTTLWRTIWVA
jgi:hypothetical protein